METAHLVSVNSFCIHHRVDVAFIDSLQRFGLIETVTVEEVSFISEEKITDLEKLVRLYHELDLNLEGLDVVTHLLERMQQMQDEIVQLRNRLSGYEE